MAAGTCMMYTCILSVSDTSVITLSVCMSIVVQHVAILLPAPCTGCMSASATCS